MSGRVVTMAAIVLALGYGCAKQPATMGASAPAPTGSSSMTTPAAQTPRQGGAATSSGTLGTAGTAARADGRPEPKDFVAIADLADIHFDFDRYDITPAAAPILDRNAAWLKSRTSAIVLIEGHCDERGTSEYNLALGDRRAKATMNYLTARGVDVRRVTVISYGEDRPQCREHTEACWAKNRRARFLVKGH
jgi:peptidoglycan-associated lipoprotein